MNTIKRILALPDLKPVQKLVLIYYAIYDDTASHVEIARFANVVLKTAVTQCHALEAMGLLAPTGEHRGLVKRFRVELPA